MKKDISKMLFLLLIVLIHAIYVILFVIGSYQQIIDVLDTLCFFKQLQQIIIDIPSIIFSIKQGLMNTVPNDNSNDDSDNSNKDKDNTFKYEYNYQYTYTVNGIEGIEQKS